MTDFSELADYIWPELEPALQIVADAVHEQNPEVLSQIVRLPAPHVPLAGYVSFVKDPIPIRDREDIVVSISCFNETSGLRCQSDISIELDENTLLDGPVTHIQTGQAPELVESQIKSWIGRTRDFILENKALIVRQLSR